MQEIIFIIEGETPAKKNSRITLPDGRTIPSKRYRDWHKLALNQVNKQKPIDMAPLNEELNISLTFIHGDLRRRDSDNGCSSILDLLQDAKVIEDDSWKIVRNITIKNEYQKNNARCYVIIQSGVKDGTL